MVGCTEAVAQPVDRGPFDAPQLRAHLAQRFQQGGNDAALAQRRDADLVQRLQVVRGGDLSREVGLEVSVVGHGCACSSVDWR